MFTAKGYLAGKFHIPSKIALGVTLGLALWPATLAVLFQLPRFKRYKTDLPLTEDKGFVKSRCFGGFSCRNRESYVDRCRHLLGAEQHSPALEEAAREEAAAEPPSGEPRSR